MSDDNFKVPEIQATYYLYFALHVFVSSTPMSMYNDEPRGRHMLAGKNYKQRSPEDGWDRKPQ